MRVKAWRLLRRHSFEVMCRMTDYDSSRSIPGRQGCQPAMILFSVTICPSMPLLDDCYMKTALLFRLTRNKLHVFSLVHILFLVILLVLLLLLLLLFLRERAYPGFHVLV